MSPIFKKGASLMCGRLRELRILSSSGFRPCLLLQLDVSLRLIRMAVRIFIEKSLNNFCVEEELSDVAMG